MGLRILLWLCIAVTLRSADCVKDSTDDERARLPELLTELDIASLEASEEDIDALKKVVKRLAPAKDGEYQVFQVFFGNEELLKEWLSGAGLGQPGVDFPMLTTIPSTSFSCRGLKGGYYADLETNCQVFHICDNGRKISFLCPNGTIFQQSQLICDWWFKVECSKSPELYEQSAEHLAQEEKKRADLKRVNSEFHRTDNNFGTSYDGKQNGRTNPFGSVKNQLTTEQQSKSRNFDSGQIFNQNGRAGNQFSQINDLALNNGFTVSQESSRQQPDTNFNTRTTNYQNIDRQQNQLIEDHSSKQYYDQRGANKYSSSQDNYYTTVGNRDNSRSGKSRPLEDINRSVTPAYTETTTFRTSTVSPPLRELQQPAESAGFARGNRYNKQFASSNQYNNSPNREPNTYNPITNSQKIRTTEQPTTQRFRHQESSQTFRQSNPQSFRQETQQSYRQDGQQPQRQESQQSFRQETPKPFRQESQQSFRQNGQKSLRQETPQPFRQETPQTFLKPKTKIPDYPYPTYAPIYRPRTTTYEPTTLTTSTPYNQDRTTNWDQTTTNSWTTGQDYRTTTETIYPDETTGTYQGSRITSTNYESTTVDSTESTPATTFANARDYGSRSSYTSNQRGSTNYQRYSTGGITYTSPSPITKLNDVTSDQNSLGTTRTQDERVKNWKTGNSRSNYRPNSISPSTEKPDRVTQVSRISRPYESSPTYQRVSSTLGPYVPFTRNYAYTTTTTTTTPKPAVYTATVPTYTTQYRSSGRIQYPSPTAVNRLRASSAYLPETNSTAKRQDSKSLIAREHAFNMLESLKGLEATVPTIIASGNRSGLMIPHSSSPATLHSLALYFATASDEFKGDKTDESEEDSKSTSKDDKSANTTSAELPTSILTEHTINSYAELFNLNNALEANANGTDSQQEGEIEDDLDLQQSEGPVAASKKSNSTKLRELAQVFTHALSAYLQDPDTFKKILAEIRPTEPPVTLKSSEENEVITTTEAIPTTSEDYPSVTKEKDEVLDFSEDVTAPRRPHLQTTTEIPTTTDDAAFGFYTTSVASSEYSTPSPNIDTDQDYLNPPANPFASAVNNAFDTNGIQHFSSAPSGPTSNEALGSDYDSYFSSDSNRLNDNSTYEPYGKYVKPANSVPIGDNYVASSTPASYEETTTTAGDVVSNQLGNENYRDNYSGSNENSKGSGENFRGSNENYRGSNEHSGESNEATTTQPFRIRYYDSTTTRPDGSHEESLVTANSIYGNYNNYNRLNSQDDRTRNNEHSTNSGESSSDGIEDQDRNVNNHWTSSPTVTQLWESTVFVDPKRINQGLTSEAASQTASLEHFDHTTHPTSGEVLVTDASSGVTPRNIKSSTPWQWASANENDAPTAFSLLPTVKSTEHTATPAPIYTTRSSITTTITSSVISTSSLPQDIFFGTKKYRNNGTENEMVRAKQMFGGLNDTSSETLMKVMKTADQNANVRQLVLLLISHCTGPLNKTREQEKQQLINALLTMPVNEFTSDESREIISGLNRLNLPADLETQSTTTYVSSTEPAATTYRSKKRRIKGSESTRVKPQSDDSSKDDSSVSDTRALELLRSLYTVAAKWG